MLRSDLPMARARAASHGCRLNLRRKNLVTPLGGAEASNTAAGASWDSRYFCTTKPPTEWPTSNGRVGRLSATDATSSTQSAIEQDRMGFGAGFFEWPRRVTAS